MDATVSTLAGKVVYLLFSVAKKEICHMWNCSEIVETIKKETEKLTNMNEMFQQEMDSAKHAGQVPMIFLEEWVHEADKIISEATEFIAKEAEAEKAHCNLRFYVGLANLHQYGKTGTRKLSRLLQHQIDGKEFEVNVSHPPPSIRFIDIYQRKVLENIDTQKLTLKKIVQAIKDMQIIGIDGLGGVGKTTLANEAAAEMKNQFDYIEYITISQIVDTKMIKGKVEVAARRIINGQKVLIILDDVWKELKLDEVGIPCGRDRMNCKILLTSRNKDVCVAMNAQQIISVNPLEKKEAWTLFERVVDKTEWDNNLKEVALKIVEGCGGLPLFVQSVGKTLKNKRYNIWETALRELQAPIDRDATFKKYGLLQLKLSYNYLEDEVTKSCFLLCSMFPQDRTISLKRLTYYGLGLGIFCNPNSNIHRAKDIVQLAVESLKSSSLLLPTDKDEFKMHGRVHDMANLITSEGYDKFLVRCGEDLKEWQPGKELQDYKKISLMGNKIYKLLHHELHFPHLDTLLLRDNALLALPDEFFRDMKKLRVLDMSRNCISSLPQSLKQLTELRMLDLSRNTSLREISLLGGLTSLDILKLRRTGITNIPEEIGKLTNLRLLDVYSCEYLSCVTPGIISKLNKLEELYLELAEKGTCHFLEDLCEIKSLKTLHLLVPELHYIPEGFEFEALIEFHIKDGTLEYQTHGCKRILEISNVSFPFPKSIMKLISVSEMLYLSNIKDLVNILPDLYQSGFKDLKYIELMWCQNVKSLVMTCDLDAMQTSLTSNDQFGDRRKFFSQLKEINLIFSTLEFLWDSPHRYISFCNLGKIKIESCPSLLMLFPLSVAKGLANLKVLDISFCCNLAVVISAGDEQIVQTGGCEIELVTQDTSIVLPLIHIRLHDLPKLDSFYSGRSNIKYPSLESVGVEYCHSMKRWSYGDNHTPKLGFDREGRSCNINDYINAVQNMENKKLEILNSYLADTDGQWYATMHISDR